MRYILILFISLFITTSPCFAKKKTLHKLETHKLIEALKNDIAQVTISSDINSVPEKMQKGWSLLRSEENAQKFSDLIHVQIELNRKFTKEAIDLIFPQKDNNAQTLQLIYSENLGVGLHDLLLIFYGFTPPKIKEDHIAPIHQAIKENAIYKKLLANYFHYRADTKTRSPYIAFSHLKSYLNSIKKYDYNVLRAGYEKIIDQYTHKMIVSIAKNSENLLLKKYGQYLEKDYNFEKALWFAQYCHKTLQNAPYQQEPIAVAIVELYNDHYAVDIEKNKKYLEEMENIVSNEISWIHAAKEWEKAQEFEQNPSDNKSGILERYIPFKIKY